MIICFPHPVPFSPDFLIHLNTSLAVPLTCLWLETSSNSEAKELSSNGARELSPVQPLRKSKAPSTGSAWGGLETKTHPKKPPDRKAGPVRAQSTP